MSDIFQSYTPFMKHPVLLTYRTRAVYFCIWLSIAVIHGAITIYFVPDLPVEWLVTDTLIFNFLFAAYAIPLWFPVSYNHWKNRSWIYNIVTHTVLLCLFLAVWLGSGYAIMLVFCGDDGVYMKYLDASIWWRIIDGAVFFSIIVLIYYLYIHVEQLKEKADNELRLNKLIRDSELNLLKSQINPHFLFNSLNSLNALILGNPAQASEMLTALSDYLRYTVLSMRQQMSDLQSEIDNIKRYLSIEKLRFGDRLNYDFHVDDSCLSMKAPSMILQPLLENAIKYSIYESIDKVEVNVDITNDGNYLCIKVSNDFNPDCVYDKTGSGTGLKNIAERLNLFYGNNASLNTKISEGKFIVIITISIDCVQQP
jgi:signal transduction histidine kinase